MRSSPVVSRVPWLASSNPGHGISQQPRARYQHSSSVTSHAPLWLWTQALSSPPLASIVPLASSSLRCAGIVDTGDSLVLCGIWEVSIR